MNEQERTYLFIGFITGLFLFLIILSLMIIFIDPLSKGYAKGYKDATEHAFSKAFEELVDKIESWDLRKDCSDIFCFTLNNSDRSLKIYSHNKTKWISFTNETWSGSWRENVHF